MRCGLFIPFHVTAGITRVLLAPRILCLLSAASKNELTIHCVPSISNRFSSVLSLLLPNWSKSSTGTSSDLLMLSLTSIRQSPIPFPYIFVLSCSSTNLGSDDFNWILRLTQSHLFRNIYALVRTRVIFHGRMCHNFQRVSNWLQWKYPLGHQASIFVFLWVTDMRTCSLRRYLLSLKCWHRYYHLWPGLPASASSSVFYGIWYSIATSGLNDSSLSVYYYLLFFNQFPFITFKPIFNGCRILSLIWIKPWLLCKSLYFFMLISVNQTRMNS